jgi:uncharacterized protein with ATP-grasp and redox domains
MPRPTDVAAAAPEITWSRPGSFPWDVFHDRHPALLDQLRDAIPYGPDQLRALSELLDESLHGTMAPLPPDAPDLADWKSWDADRHLHRPWTEASFLWAESYFYRRLLTATGYFTPGPWQGVDPFGPTKDADLHGGKLSDELNALNRLLDLSPEQQDHAVLHSSLWGNRADLSFQLTATGTSTQPGTNDATLLKDDSTKFWATANSWQGKGTVALLLDNAGRELLPDLVLVDHLLHTGRAARIDLYVKPHPYYVSDATTPDVLACLRRMTAGTSTSTCHAATITTRLNTAISDGHLTLATHPFLCAPLPFSEMPADLRTALSTADLTILKGDLNYRRLVGDRHWPADTDFTAATAHFPTPVAALRLLKSEVALGLDAATATHLTTTDPNWRTSGQHAVLQVSSRTSW